MVPTEKGFNMKRSCIYFRNLVAPVAAMMILTCGGTSHAQDAPSYIRFEVAGWTFAPAIVQTSVEGFLAWVEDVEAVGENITVMWYQHESDGNWTTWAWQSNDVGVAALYVRGLMGDELVFASDTDVIAWVEAASGPAASLEVVDGLFFDDPFQAVVASHPDPPELMDVLVAVGWKAAPNLSTIAVEAAADCDITPETLLLNDLKSDAELALFGQTAVTDDCDAGWICKCKITYGTWTCTAWVLDFTVTIPGGLNCHYERTCTRPWTKKGRHWTCFSCAKTGTNTKVELQTVTVIDPDPCVPPPP